MGNNTSAYHMPPGYSGMRTAIRSYQYLKDPIKFVSTNMALFGGNYSARLPQYPNFIITQDAAFINHVLKDNHTNYHKSPLSSGRVAEYLGKGMLFTNGEAWLKQRRLAQPGFHREKIQALYATVVKAIGEYIETMPTGSAVDVYPLLHQLAFNIVIKSLFDIDLSANTMQILGGNFSEIQDFVIKDVNQPFRRPFYPITGSERKALRKSAEIKAIFRGLIHERIKLAEESENNHKDLLDMLLQSTYEDTGLHMEEDQVIDELLVLMFAGHETTANTLSWLLYLLSTSTEVLNKLKASIKQTDILSSPKNEYLNAVINEGMRLYPAAWMTDRVALEDDHFGGYRYPKGTIIISFFYGAHRDKAYWPDADSFNPDRFLDETGKAKKYKNYFPFGAGPRMCIGNNFAMAEMAFFLHAFLQKFTITNTGQTPKTKPLLTLRPDKVVLGLRRV
jgi:cytochrome P450